MDPFLKLKKIIAKQLHIADPDTIIPSARLREDFNATDLNIGKFVKAIVIEYDGIAFNEEDVVGVVTLQDLLNTINEKIALQKTYTSIY